MKQFKNYFLLFIVALIFPGIPMYLGHLSAKKGKENRKKMRIETFMQENLGTAHYVYPNDECFLCGDYVFQVNESDFIDRQAWFDALPSQIHKDIVLRETASPMVMIAKDGRTANNMRLAYNRVAYRLN